LKIPEIIWRRALEEVEEISSNYISNSYIICKTNSTPQFKTKENALNIFSQITLKFLSALMKNSKDLHYERLEDELVNYILTNHSSSLNKLELKILITKSQLEKYDEKEYFKKAIENFLEIKDNHINETNFVLSNLIYILMDKITEYKFNSDQKDKINEYIINNIGNIIDQSSLVENFQSQESLSLCKYIFEESYYTGNKYKSIFDLENILIKIITKISEKTKSNLDWNMINIYLEIFCKFQSYNLNLSTETIMSNLNQLFLNKPLSNNFKKILIENLILLGQDELKLFSDKLNVFTAEILSLIKKFKLSDISILKGLFEKLILMIYVSIFNT
jgi:hypothetical protein